MEVDHPQEEPAEMFFFSGQQVQRSIFVLDFRPASFVFGPQSVIRANVAPVKLSEMKVTKAVTGMARPATSDAPLSRTNTTRISEARIRPIGMASRTLVIVSLTMTV